MNLNSLSRLDRNDLLGVLGLETKSSLPSSVATTLGTLGIGVLIGVGIGFLLAPKAGRGLREDLRERLRRAPESLSVGVPGDQPAAAHKVG